MNLTTPDSRPDNPRAAYSTYDMYKAIYMQAEKLDDTLENIFTPAFVAIFDSAVVENNKYLLSKEQEAFIDRYFSEADAGNGFSADTGEFDSYLGSYEENNNG